MTPEHEALLARVEAANLLRLSYPRGLTDPQAQLSLSDLDTLLTLARRGAAADGLVEALKWIADGRPEFDSTHKANWARKEKATAALAAYEAATKEAEG